jgi:hypothetical protein
LLGDGNAHHRKRRDDLRLVVREHLAPCAAILGRHVVAQTILRGIGATGAHAAKEGNVARG